MSTITLLRHSECFHNINAKYDFLNCPLTPKGITQSQKLTGHFDLIICSPLRRCKDTLKYSNIKGSKTEFTELCREKMLNFADLTENDNIDYRETDDKFIKRCKEFHEYLKYQSQHYDKILVISHYLFIRALTGLEMDNAEIQGIKMKDIHIKN